MQIRIGEDSAEAHVLVDAFGKPVAFSSGLESKATTAVVSKVDSIITDAATLIAANPNRKGVPSVYYDGTATMYLLLGNGIPSPTNYTIKLGQGFPTYYEPPVASYTGKISAIWSAVAGSAMITELQ